jgi:uroporphyrinogen decarboxylase
MAKLDSFEIPDPLEDSQYDDFRLKKEMYGDEKWIIGSSQISIFEACWYLRGLDTFMMDMALEPEYCEKLMDKVMPFPLKASRKYIELGADMVCFGDDVSMQTGMTGQSHLALTTRGGSIKATSISQISNSSKRR